MANNNEIQLVVTVNADPANKSIKSVNASLTGMEQAALQSGRRASSGIDGMTASMVKGATAGNLLAEGIKKALSWVAELTIGTAKYAARTEVLSMVSQQLAKVNGIAGSSVDVLVDRIKALGITTQEANGVIQKMIFAQLDLGKATQLARVAQDAAVIAGVDSSEALENIILGITTGQTRLLHNMGLQISLLNVEQEAAKKLGHQLSDTEKREAMLNAVLVEGVKIRGTYDAAMQNVGKQMTSLTRYFNEAKNAVGEQFLPMMREIVERLKELAMWITANPDAVVTMTKVLLGLGGALLVVKAGLVGLLVGNPWALLATGIAAAGGVMFYEFKRMRQGFDEMDQAYKKFLFGSITDAKSGSDITAAIDRVNKAMEAGAIDAKAYGQALDMIDAAKAKIFGWGTLADVTKGLGIKVLDPKAEAAAAAALAEEIKKAQLGNEKTFRDRALEAGKSGMTGFAKDVADLNAEIAKRTHGTDEKTGASYYVALTKKAWNSIIEEARLKLAAFQKHFAIENRKAMADHLEGVKDAADQEMKYEAARYQQRLQNDVEIASRNLDHIRDVYTVEQDRAAMARDAHMRQLDGVDAQTIQQKVAVEQQKADIEIEYLEKVHEIKQRLFDLDTSRQVLEEEGNLKRLGYQADEIKRRIAELTQDRQVIREANDEATDEAVQAARESASNRATQLVRDHNRQLFESLKQQAGGVFDALLQKSQSVWSAIGNSFKVAMLTAIKDVITSRVAAFFTELITGKPVPSVKSNLSVVSALGLPRFADGGVTRGPSIAGEAGPELIVPLAKLKAWLAGTPIGRTFRGAAPDPTLSSYRGVLGMLREEYPAFADWLRNIGSDIWNDPGIKYLPGPQAVAVAAPEVGLRLNSLRDAEAYAYEVLGVRSLYSTAKTSEIAAKVVEDMNTAVLRGAKYLPDTVTIDPLLFARSNTTVAQVGKASGGGTSLMVNPKHSFWEDPASAAYENFMEGHWSAGNPENVIFHELGHVGHAGKGGYADLLKRNFNFPYTDAEKRIAANVSNYATTNEREFVAEVFAGKLAGRVYPAEVEQWYKILGGPLPDVPKNIERWYRHPETEVYEGIEEFFGWSDRTWKPGTKVPLVNIPSMDVGGTVAKTGLAEVHAGEAVVPQADTLRKSIEQNTEALRTNAKTTGQTGTLMAGIAAFVLGLRSGASPMYRLAGMLGIGAAPVFAGGVIPGVTPGTTPPFIPGGGGGVTSKAGAASLFNFNWSNLKNLASWKNLYGAMAMGGGLLMINGTQRGNAASTIGGGALMGAGIGLSGGPIGAVGGAGIGLFMDAMRRGGGWGVAEGAAGGAMFAGNITGWNPIAMAVGAGVGFIAGLIRLGIKGASEKAREKIKALYGVDISDKAILSQIVQTAKQAYGGNLDMAIRTPQVRDLIQLYAMTTGQRTSGMPATMTASTLAQSGGSLYQMPTYQNGQALSGSGGLPTFDSIGAGTPSGAGAVVIQLDGPATTAILRGEAVQAIVDNPRIVQGAVMSASKSNAGRRQLTSVQLSPGLVTT